jgi:hypothetical protein
VSRHDVWECDGCKAEVRGAFPDDWTTLALAHGTSLLKSYPDTKHVCSAGCAMALIRDARTEEDDAEEADAVVEVS